MAPLVALVRNVWALALRGIFAILFGLFAFMLPGLTLGVLIVLFAAYAFVDGVLAIVAGIRAAEHHERYVSLLWRGLVGIAASLGAFLAPAITAIALTLLVGAWAIVSGALETVAGVHLRRSHGEWLLIANGALSVLFGLLLVVFPPLGLLTLIWLIGGYAIVFGILMLAVAVRIRRRHAGPHPSN